MPNPSLIFPVLPVLGWCLSHVIACYVQPFASDVGARGPGGSYWRLYHFQTLHPLRLPPTCRPHCTRGIEVLRVELLSRIDKTHLSTCPAMVRSWKKNIVETRALIELWLPQASRQTLLSNISISRLLRQHSPAPRCNSSTHAIKTSPPNALIPLRNPKHSRRQAYLKSPSTPFARADDPSHPLSSSTSPQVRLLVSIAHSGSSCVTMPPPMPSLCRRHTPGSGYQPH